MGRKSHAKKDVCDEDMEVEASNNLDCDEEGGIRVSDDIYIPPPVKRISELEVAGPRLMIAKIINTNFKSYAGTQIVGPFHKCFSAIVGPNGSGKSNVIDSMLFVFGYRASKIRSKKISVLIHNSNLHPNINSCTVSVQFQKIIDKVGSDYDVVPNSEFVISRTAFKDNSSYYELNKRRVQFKEIAKLLRAQGVDLDHNRFLILQGEVEQIAMMKPKAQNENDTGMLEFLEDIIGTVRYKEPLEKLSEKTDQMREYRVEQLNRLRMIEKEKAALEEPMQEAVQYLKLENIITKLQHQLYHCKRFETKKEFVKQEKQVEELNKDISDLLNEMKQVHADRNDKNKVMMEKSKKWEKLQEQKDEITGKFDKIRKQDESLHAELVETNNRRKTNIASLKSEKTKLEELQRVPERNASDIKDCEQLNEKHMADREREEAALATLMTELREKTEPLLEERSNLEKKLIILRKRVNEAQAPHDIAKKELELYTSTEHAEKEKLDNLKESLKRTVETLAERKQQLKSLEGKIPASEQSLRDAQDELSQVKNEEIEMASKLKKMRITFEEQKSAMHASSSRNKILDSLMREKKEGRLPGVFGRLGDLGAIDEKYDVAISTACGPLDNIVVDTVSTAQACITFLRQNGIGRATFIPLEKQQRFVEKCSQPIHPPENVSRLFDLITVEDERILPAFYYGLHDTLVANNLDQATRIAYGYCRYRVVTLNGELIELSGTMSGGGRTVLRGRMGRKVVRNEPSAVDLENLQSNLDTVYNECNRLRARHQPLENQIHTLSMALKEMMMDRQKCNIETKTLQEQEPSLRKQLEVQAKKAVESISDPKRVKQMEKTVNTTKEALDKAEEASRSVENEVERINKEIDQVSGNRVKDQQKKISTLQKVIDKIKAEVCRLQVAIKTAERNVKKTTQHIETLENDVLTCEQRLRNIQAEKLEIEEQGKVFIKELTELTEALAERDKALSLLKEELNALQTRENKIKSVKIDLDQKMNEAKSFWKELKQRIPEYTERIAALKLQPIPGVSLEKLQELTEEELNEMDEKVISGNLQKAKKRLPAETPNMHLIVEYRQKDAIYIKRVEELEKATAECNRIQDIYDSARRRRAEEFLAGFTIITEKLKEMYQMITLGGDAELELVDSLDPFSEGIVFSVRPPKKSWKNICNLSGGEKTLSSLALVFALHHYKPTPLYFMDEIDAALDFKNVSIVGNYIKERTKNAQFIIISLRSNMFELADYLVGIYKTFNCTKTVTVDLGKYYKTKGIAPPLQITSKTMYPSQMLKFSSQQIQNTQSGQKENCSAKTTNSLNLQQIVEDAAETNGTALLNLPDLSLLPSPEKTRSSLGSTCSPKSRRATSTSREPLSKKRRM